jgi:hypothetical protein
VVRVDRAGDLQRLLVAEGLSELGAGGHRIDCELCGQ